MTIEELMDRAMSLPVEERALLADSILRSLSVSERIQLVEYIWDSIAEVPEQVGLSEGQKAELDRRLEAYHRNPGEGSPWSAVRERIGSGR